MSTLPLSFRLRNAVVEKHQFEGMDPSDRYFNRAISVKRVDRGYSAKVMYESLERESAVHPTVSEGRARTKGLGSQVRFSETQPFVLALPSPRMANARKREQDTRENLALMAN